LPPLLLTKQHHLSEHIFHHQNPIPPLLSPFHSSLLITPIKTLPLRIPHHQPNPHHLAHFLNQHPQIQHLLYPPNP
ncbi:PLP-dependent transferase, partial [Bacillus pumilus]|uniref:PLP-dependent transferase n=1 Tax=Bacillus pumilus TaxID=1408 RepID=UPI0016424168